jgi:hypothetical protein
VSHVERHPAINLRTTFAPEQPTRAPERPATPPTPPETGDRGTGGSEPEQPRNKNRKRVRAGVIGSIALGTAAAVLAGGAWLLPKGSSDPPVTDPVPTEPAEQPGESPEQPVNNGEYTVESLEVPANLSTEELAELMIENRITGWLNAGATNDLYRIAKESGDPWDVVVERVSAENRDIFADALFIDGWQDNPELKESVENFRNENWSRLGLYASTAFKTDGPEIEGFRSWIEVNGVTETQDGTSRILAINTTEYDNREAAGLTLESGTPNGIWTITLVVENGVEKIASIDSQPLPE